MEQRKKHGWAQGARKREKVLEKLVLPGSAREGNFTKLQRSHHEKTMSLLDGVFSTEGEILHNDFSGYFES